MRVTSKIIAGRRQKTICILNLQRRISIFGFLTVKSSIKLIQRKYVYECRRGLWNIRIASLESDESVVFKSNKKQHLQCSLHDVCSLFPIGGLHRRHAGGQNKRKFAVCIMNIWIKRSSKGQSIQCKSA